MKPWTLFLDRDGVVNRRLPGDYVKCWEEFEFLEGVLESLRILDRYFGRIILVTNQQGIGKGLMTEEDLAKVHGRMLEAVKEAAGRIDAVYYCPELESRNSPDRKPNPGMAYRARREFPDISFDRSVMVGDSLSDMEFGARLNMVNVLITTKAEALEGLEEGKPATPIHWRFASLLDFAGFVEERGGM